MITSFLPSLFTLQALWYSPPCSLSNSRHLFSFIVIHIFTSTYKCLYNIYYIHIQYIYGCSVCTVLCVRISRTDHLALDNQLTCSSLGETISPTLGASSFLGWPRPWGFKTLTMSPQLPSSNYHRHHTPPSHILTNGSK